MQQGTPRTGADRGSRSTIPIKGAPALWPQHELPLASDPCQRWHVGEEARKTSRTVGPGASAGKLPKPVAGGGAGHPCREGSSEVKLPRSSASHALISPNSSQESTAACPQVGAGSVQPLPHLASVLSSVKWVRPQSV